MVNVNLSVIYSSLEMYMSIIIIYLNIYIGWGKSHGNYFFFFFEDTTPVGKCDIYRRKDKVLTTCVDTMPADIPHDI